MAAVVNVIGVISGIATLWGWGQSVFPTVPSSPQVVMRYQIGVDGFDPGSDAAEYDGPLNQHGVIVPGNVFINSAGEVITGDTCTGDDLLIGSGGFEDLTCDLNSETQPVTVSIEYEVGAWSACFAYIATTFYDGQQFAFVGNWARECGVAWYYSGVLRDGSSEYLECMWLMDANAGDVVNEWEAKRIRIGWRFFAADPPENAKDLCGIDKGFEAYDVNDNWIAPEADRKRKRDGKKGRRSDNRLVITHQIDHNVIELCDHPSSKGPDIANLAQGLFCDMDTGLVSPICGDVVTTDCFQLNTTTHQKRDGNHIVRKFTSTIEW